MYQSKFDSTFLSICGYLVLQTAGPFLKLAGLAGCSWWKATVLLWAPWVLLALVAVFVVGWRLWERRGLVQE